MSKLPKRRIIVEFLTNRGKLKQIEGINIKFSVQSMCYAYGSQANIELCNLSMDDISYLTTYLSPFFGMRTRKQVTLFCGYDDNVKQIFSGDIWTATPVKRGGDISLQIKAIKSFFSSSNIASKTISGPKITVKDACSQVASWGGLGFSWLAKSQKTIDTFTHTGSLVEAMKKLSQLDDIIVYEEDDQLKVIDKNPQGLGVRELSAKTGLIGMPRLNHFGCEVKTLIDHTVKLGSTIILNSELCPSANGSYWVYSAIHQGSLREQQFYSTFKCRRGGQIWTN